MEEEQHYVLQIHCNSYEEMMKLVKDMDMHVHGVFSDVTAAPVDSLDKKKHTDATTYRLVSVEEARQRQS